mmetsp:Transcript_6722/g.16136  ORF Transcript_6722/g.16136 Transcript_6722/m.16136 type:complete len:227 (+) Transcript_6722:401-1081(+)
MHRLRQEDDSRHGRARRRLAHLLQDPLPAAADVRTAHRRRRRLGGAGAGGRQQCGSERSGRAVRPDQGERAVVGGRWSLRRPAVAAEREGKRVQEVRTDSLRGGEDAGRMESQGQAAQADLPQGVLPLPRLRLAAPRGPVRDVPDVRRATPRRPRVQGALCRAAHARQSARHPAVYWRGEVTPHGARLQQVERARPDPPPVPRNYCEPCFPMEAPPLWARRGSWLN